MPTHGALRTGIQPAMFSLPQLTGRLFLVIAASSLSAAPIVQFDINDNLGASPTMSGWVGVTGAANDAETLTGTNGIHTLVLATSGDGQDRDRNSGSYTADAAIWRDFWFVSNSTVGGAQATATLSGFVPDTAYSVEIWAFDFNSTGARSATWTDAMTGNSATSTFNGSSSPAPTSLADYATRLTVRSDALGVLRLTAAAAAGGSTGLPNIFINALRVSSFGGTPIPMVEAEAGTLGADYGVVTVAGSTAIAPSVNNTAFVPGAASRVAGYTVTFPRADLYQLYARVYVGPGTFSDDSFFYAASFGVKSPTVSGDWVAVLSGLVDTGYSAGSDPVVVGGGSAGAQVWKWVKFGTFFNVPESGLAQTFQIGAREDGFYVDKLAFGPADIPLTVGDLESGILPSRPATDIYEGPDGVALHRFDEPYKGTNYEGSWPGGGLVQHDGRLWGVTRTGGLQGAGVVFRVAPDGSDFAVVNTLPVEIGASRPHGALVAGPGGVFYGVTITGGASGAGTVFRRGVDGSLTVLRSFAAPAAHTGINTGGAAPCGPLLLAGDLLYGVTRLGGADGQGVVFSLRTDGTAFTVLRDFGAPNSASGANAHGARPQGGLLLSGGRIYGTTTSGGPMSAGVVYAMNLDGSEYAILHAFSAPDSETLRNEGGAWPSGGLAVAGSRLYGVAIGGGVAGGGVVYSLGLNASEFRIEHAFESLDPASAKNSGGAFATGRPLVSGNWIYGVASAGGAGGTGALYALHATTGKMLTIHDFETLDTDGLNARGAIPTGDLVRTASTLAGVTARGGPAGTGVVFSVPLPTAMEITTEVDAVGGGRDLVVIGRGAPFADYSIEATDDLSASTAWSVVLTGSADADGRLVYREPVAGHQRRFFRLKSLP